MELRKKTWKWVMLLLISMIWGVAHGEMIPLDQVLWIFVIFIGVYPVNKQKLVKV